jgi:hypothetical protein
MTLKPGTGTRQPVRWDRFETACKVVEQARDGLVSVLLTGVGEPLLHPEDITDYLNRMKDRFPLVEIQTNGVCVGELGIASTWGPWWSKGLTQVSISITHDDPVRSNQIMGIRKPRYNFWDAAQLLKTVGLSVRLNCTMTKGGICEPHQVSRLIDRCASEGIDKLTLREVETPSDPRDWEVSKWIEDQKPRGAAKRLHHYLEMQGAHRLLDLPHGGIVYDVDGQNVAVTNCLTETNDPNDIRQIIFFPDGRISYNWRHAGARIL